MRLGVLASGRGTLLEAILADALPVAVVVVDRPCRALDIAREQGVPAVLVERTSFGPSFDRVAYTEDVLDALAQHEVDLVVMAGFMTVLEKPMLDAFEGRVLNTHPSLLPAFKGARAVRDALESGVKVTGCTVHVATMELDEGPILAQAAVPVLEGDDEATLHERIKRAERPLYVATIRSIVDRGSVT